MALTNITATTTFPLSYPVTTIVHGTKSLITTFTNVTSTTVFEVTTTVNSSSLFSAIPPVGWTPACVSNLFASSYPPFMGAVGAYGLVNGEGRNVTVFDQDTWGITYSTCQQYCGSIGGDSFSFETFAGDLTNYLLPWLALCAQLPYEAKGGYSNIMSFFLAVGSPMLTTFSLFVAMLDRQLARKRFDDLKRTFSKVLDDNRKLELRIDCARDFLREAGHVPIRASDISGWLTSLAKSDDNTEWWVRLGRNLLSSRREVTPSLVAQICVAILAYALTVIATYVSDHGEPAVTLQVTAGSLWLWLVPVIIGWIIVGTQKEHDSIEKALAFDHASHIERPNIKSRQEGIMARSGVNGNDIVNNPDVEIIPKLWGFDIQGDECREGPIYCYARLFTWSQAQRSILEVFRETLQILGNKPRDPREEIGAYRSWSEIDSEIYKHMLSGIFMAFIVQWGTTGPAVMLAYLTYTPGLGCRSGSYLIYGVFATLVFALMLASMLLSHQAMLMVETEHRPKRPDSEAVNGTQNRRRHSGAANTNENHELNNLPTSSSSLGPPPSLGGQSTGTDVTGTDPPPSTTGGRSSPIDTTPTDTLLGRPKPELVLPTSRKFVIIASLAILLRQTGKILAIANAMWLIISSLIEFSSGFSNCYCQSTYIQLQANAYVTLFPDAKSLEQKSIKPSAMATLTSAVTCFITIFVFLLSSYY